MNVESNAHLVDGKYAIGDLVDLNHLRDIFERFTQATGFTIGFLDHPGLNILVATGWRDICTRFHRGCPASTEICTRSNIHLLDNLQRPQQLEIEPCDHGLVDCATPIIIKGIHIASLATGQLLLKKPDLRRFRKQAALYGYDEAQYLKALAEIPVVTEEQLRNVTAFLGSLALVITELGYTNLKIKEETASLEREIAERKRAEELRIRMEAQMLQVQKLESLGLLAGGIAHDFNNLLTGIQGNIDLALADAPASSPLRGHLDDIATAARQAADLCRQMLAYSGRGRFVSQAIDLRDLIAELGHMLDVSISKKVSLCYQLSESLPAIEADPTQIRQVIMNLIINASEAIGEGEGVITISVGAGDYDREALADMAVHGDMVAGRYVFLTVQDNGCGMDEETAGRVFDPFFTTKFTGRGLGLAAASGIVRGHKGGIKIESEPGKGTAFTVLLPAVDRAVDRLPAASGGDMLWRRTGTILLADDERIVRDIARKILERIGFRVLVAKDGAEVVKLFREADGKQGIPIDCVILDLTMPKKNGAEAFREIRAIRQDVPVILSSGFNEQEVVQRFAGVNFSGFLHKPYHVKELAEKVRAALGA